MYVHSDERPVFGSCRQKLLVSISKYVCMFILTGDLFSGLVGRNCLCVSTVFTRLEAGASISFLYFVDQACNQGRLLIIIKYLVLFCTLL